MITRFLEWLFPMRSLKTWSEELADWEAATEVWEPDELWAAQQSSAEPPTAGRPADAPLPPGVSVGGPLKSDEQVIEELVADYRAFLREQFKK